MFGFIGHFCSLTIWNDSKEKRGRLGLSLARDDFEIKARYVF